MEEKKMCIGLYTGSVDKLTAAGVIISGAAALDMKVDIYVLLQGARAFRKDIGDNPDKLHMAENSSMKEEFMQALKNLNVKTWVEFFREAKELTDVKIHICGLAGKIWGGEKLEDFLDIADDICGIGAYIASAQEADVNLFI
ncbi:MAG TPA: DsrE/DsrF/DrsH-like family protein [Bacteroidales bacterium]|nr:DsrE/DsrF/DrsH-like family protein [Bacteroidales bacterium]HPF02777.1 DsrE/DsrF/DrsH-like family protein [Bacteroidales bacterium]HPJ58907.1 DsrE/DsrF/DrsH-like family protein [Bacteroidales bacterium]HPR12161.1 DsrE/DsrF/DrsH-like family protein [Bacteroidales bacterium]HRW84844.1 DsrE/DsrF/DrsH-like family protein [Bacteroidales bacterium]